MKFGRCSSLSSKKLYKYANFNFKNFKHLHKFFLHRQTILINYLWQFYNWRVWLWASPFLSKITKGRMSLDKFHIKLLQLIVLVLSFSNFKISILYKLTGYSFSVCSWNNNFFVMKWRVNPYFIYENQEFWLQIKVKWKCSISSGLKYCCKT
jgi:hypothetical protein